VGLVGNSTAKTRAIPVQSAKQLQSCDCQFVSLLSGLIL
jgi:hypothetical protein